VKFVALLYAFPLNFLMITGAVCIACKGLFNPCRKTKHFALNAFFYLKKCLNPWLWGPLIRFQASFINDFYPWIFACQLGDFLKNRDSSILLLRAIAQTLLGAPAYLYA